MAKKEKTQASHEPEALVIHGVVVAQRTLPCASHNLIFFSDRCRCINENCDFEADVVYAR